MEFCKKEMIQIKDSFWTATQQENGIQQKDLWNTLEKKQLLLTGAWRTKNVGEDMTAFATVLMAKQMLTQEVNGNYGDKIEQELYNAILCKLEENARNGVRSCQALVVSGFYLKEDGYEEVYSFEREEYYEPKQLILLPYYFCGEGDETEKLVWINRL